MQSRRQWRPSSVAAVVDNGAALTDTSSAAVTTETSMRHRSQSRSRRHGDVIDRKDNDDDTDNNARRHQQHSSPTQAFVLRGSVVRTDLPSGLTLVSYNITVENGSGMAVATFCPRLDLRALAAADIAYDVASVHASLGTANERFDGVRRRVLLHRPVTLPPGAAILRVCLRLRRVAADAPLLPAPAPPTVHLAATTRARAIFSFTGDFDQAGGNNGSLCVRLFRTLEIECGGGDAGANDVVSGSRDGGNHGQRSIERDGRQRGY